MSTEVTPIASPPTSPTAVTSPSPAAPGSTSPVSPEPFRYGSSAPSWAQGKTAEEVLGIAQQLEGVVRQHIQTPATPGRDPSTGQFTAPAATTPAYDPDSYLQRRDIESIAPRLINEATSSQFNSVYNSLAQTNLDNVRREYAPIFQKYGPEVLAYVAKMPVQERTVDNLTMVVKLVRADHVDELASDIASQRLAGMEPALRSNGSPSVPVSSNQPNNTLQSELLPEDWKKRAGEVGITESAMDEFCRANDITREQFIAQFRTTAITEARR